LKNAKTSQLLASISEKVVPLCASQIVFDFFQKRALSRSVQLEAVHLEALLYLDMLSCINCKYLKKIPFQAPIYNLNLCLQPDITPERTELPEGQVADFQTKNTDIGLEISHSPSGILSISGVMSSCRHRFKLQMGA
jgi:hypothetical protein